MSCSVDAAPRLPDVEQLRIAILVLVERVVILAVHDEFLRGDVGTVASGRLHPLEQRIGHLVEVLTHAEVASFEGLLAHLAQLGVRVLGRRRLLAAVEGLVR